MIANPGAIRIFVANLDIGRQWYSKALELDPSFCNDQIVTFVVAGCLLTLCVDDAVTRDGSIVYWAVDDLQGEYQRVSSIGHPSDYPIQKLSANLTTAEVMDPFGNVFGLIASKDNTIRKGRQARIAQKFALQNVRATLDEFEREKVNQKKMSRVIGWILGLITILSALIFWAIVIPRDVPTNPPLKLSIPSN